MTKARLTPLTRRLLATALPTAVALVPAGAGLQALGDGGGASTSRPCHRSPHSTGVAPCARR